MRPTIYVFLHIPKTAGITLRSILTQLVPPDRINGTPPFPSEEAEERYNAIMRRIEQADKNDLLKLPEKWAESADPNSIFARAYRAISPDEFHKLELFMDHYWYGIHDVIGKPVTYLTMIRAPVERVLSAYQHLVTRHGLRASLSHFVSRARGTVDNNQTRRLVGPLSDGRDIRRIDLDEELFEEAKRNLAGFGWVGVTERFDESLLVLRERFDLPGIFYRSENVGQGRPAREDVDPETIQQIEDLNRYDYRLWLFANELLDDRRPGRWRRELKDFRRMNARPTPGTTTSVHRALSRARRLARSLAGQRDS